jgi:hypothetical protein
MTDTIDATDNESIILALQDRNALLETALREAQAAANRRLIHAELKAEALKNGMFDLDGLKLIEAQSIAVNDAGDVEGVATAIYRLRQEKPWLFLSPNSSSTAGVPKTSSLRTKHATEMTVKEWRTARADLLRRR